MKLETLKMVNLPPNLVGTDYYIGDVHGCFEHVMRLMVEVNFDVTRDRLISVGDIIDRGPMSLECLGLLREPWFFMVMANHEEMMLHAYLGENDPRYNWSVGESWFPNGGRWALDAWIAHRSGRVSLDDKFGEIRDFALETINNLPHVLHVEQRDGSFIHVVHAEFPVDGLYTTENLMSQEYMQKMLNKSFDTEFRTYGFRWHRGIFAPFYKEPINKLSQRQLKRQCAWLVDRLKPTTDLIISGHTVCHRPVRVDNYLNLDTGASLGGPVYGLSCYNATSGEILTIRQQDIVRDVEPFTIETGKLNGEIH